MSFTAPDATVKGSFDLSVDAALRGLTSIRDRGVEADTTLERLGRRMDDLSRKVITPRIELRGLDRVNAQLTELEFRLNRLGRSRSTPGVGIGGGFGRGGQGLVAGGGGTPLFGSLGGLGGALPWWALGLPLVPQLLGGGGALLSSAGGAALGAGVVGLGGAAPLAAGAGLTLAVARPAIQAIGEITKAQDAYTQAVQRYGRASAQAATAGQALNAAVAGNPAAAGAARQLGGFRAGFTAATAGARANVYGGVSGVLANARRATPTIGLAATAATGASAGAATAFTGFLAQPQEQGMLLALTGAFARELPIAERSAENLATTFGHLAVQAIPFFHEANVWVMNWTAGLARTSADSPRVHSGMQQLVTDARDWAKLTGAAARDVRDLFAPGQQAGDSMVVQLTGTLDRWDVWLRNNPEKVQNFFRQGEQGVSRIATILANLTGDVWQLFRALDPILSRAEQFLQFASGIGGGSLLAGGGLLYGAYEGARAGLGGRGPSPGRALGSFLGGSAGGLLPFGGRGGGGLVVGAAAGGAFGAAGRASNLEVARGRLASGAILLGGATTGPDAVLARRAAAAEAGGFRGAIGDLVTSSPAAARIADATLTGAHALQGAVAGAARIIAPLAAISGVITAGTTSGGAPTRINAGLSSTLSMLTLGLVPQTSFQHVLSGAFGAAGTGISLAGDPTLAGSLNRLGRQAGAVRSAAALPGIRQQVAQGFAAPGPLSEMSPADATRMAAFLNNALITAETNAGAGAAGGFENAFTAGLERGTGPRKAVGMLLGGIGGQISALGPTGAKRFASDTAQWAMQLEAQNPALQRPLNRLMTGIVGDINRMNHAVGSSMSDLQRKVFFFNGQILTGSKAAWAQIGDALTNPMSVAEEKLTGIFGSIQSQAIGALEGMGFNKQVATGIVKGLVKGGTAAAYAGALVNVASGGLPTVQTPGGAVTQHATGGMIGGKGLLDTVGLADGSIAAPGEAYIANRHTMQALTSATLAKYGKTAWQIIRDENRPHSAPPRRFAVGGSNTGSGALIGGNFVPEPGTNFTYGQEPQIASALTQLARDLHATIYGISGYRSPAHSVAVGGFADDPHTRGQAADIGYNSLARASAAQLTAAQLAAVGLWRPFDPSGDPGNPEVNHVQLLAGGAQGALFGGGPRMQSALTGVTLRAPRITGLSGTPGAMATGAGRAYATGLQARLNATLGAGGGGAGSISAQGFSGGGSPTANQTLGRQMMLSAGWGADQWPSLLALWNQESGWNANAVNPSSGASGIPQALGHGNAFRLGDAPAQIAWGLNYIRGRYGSPAAAEAHERAFNWYATGGRVNWAGWNARGGRYSVSSPTLFGAGERGQREDVSITPAGKGGHGVTVNFHGVTFVGGDKRGLESIAEQVAAKIINALDRTEGAGDRELMGAQS